MAKKTDKDKKDKTITFNNIQDAFESRWGKGSIMSLADDYRVKCEVIPSQSISLDAAMGIGGYPRGRIIEIFGPESSGKCLVGDTHVFHRDGIFTIEEIFEDNGILPSCSNKTKEKSTKLFNGEQETENTTHFTCNNRKKVKKITTNSGIVVKSTHNHPWLVINEAGFLIWKTTKQLSNLDYVVVSRNCNFNHSDENNDEMYALGLLVADGTFGDKRLSITNDDPDIKDFIENKLSDILSINFHKYKNNDCGSFNYHFNSKEMVSKFYEKYGYCQSIASTKYVSKYIRSSKHMKSFLQGYYDCECSIDVNSKTIEVSSASHKLLEQIKLILLSFGIISYLDEKYVNAYEDNDYWRLSIYGDDTIKFKEIIGTRSQIRKTNLDKLIKSSIPLTNIDIIPNINILLDTLYKSDLNTTRKDDRIFRDYISGGHSVSYYALNKVLDSDVGLKYKGIYEYLKYLQNNNYYFDKIETIEEDGDHPTFDFAMEKTHSFIANGIVSHNTTLALHAVASAQKNGGGAAFIDAEHALSPTLMVDMGIDPEKVLISQPDSGEQALEMCELLVESNAVDIVVVDSVAALVPLAELEGGINENKIGAQARMMSQFLRRIASKIKKSKTSVIFINQIRNKIGILFGSPETTSGGNALKFYASIRLDIRKRQQIKNGEASIGHEARIKVIKNKLASPFKICDVPIIYGKGIDYVGDLIAAATKCGVLTKSGSWFNYKDNRLGNGAQGTIEFLNKNQDFITEIDDEVRKILFSDLSANKYIEENDEVDSEKPTDTEEE